MAKKGTYVNSFECQYIPLSVHLIPLFLIPLLGYLFTTYKFEITASIIFFLYFADRASQYIYLNINQHDALNFIMSLLHASTCFEHKCSKHVEA